MKKKSMLWILIVVVIVLAITAILWGYVVSSNVEQAKYTVVESFGDIEIRDYAPMIIAEVRVSGDRDNAANKGFRLLAGYIFGDNRAQEKIAMTTPVIQESTKIAMTAPVTQISDHDGWKVRFVMPSSYSIQNLPKPNNDLVKLIPTESKRFVVIRFSGSSGEENLQTHRQMLLDFVKLKQLKIIAQPTYAFFNPPWTFPALRRNEIMIELKR
jgi:hypothetical protein